MPVLPEDNDYDENGDCECIGGITPCKDHTPIAPRGLPRIWLRPKRERVAERVQREMFRQAIRQTIPRPVLLRDRESTPQDVTELPIRERNLKNGMGTPPATPSPESQSTTQIEIECSRSKAAVQANTASAAAIAKHEDSKKATYQAFHENPFFQRGGNPNLNNMISAEQTKSRRGYMVQGKRTPSGVDVNHVKMIDAESDEGREMLADVYHENVYFKVGGQYGSEKEVEDEE